MPPRPLTGRCRWPQALNPERNTHDVVLLQVRALRSSQRLHELVGGSDGLLVLPLHGGLPPSQQSRVFERPAAGVRKVRSKLGAAEP